MQPGISYAMTDLTKDSFYKKLEHIFNQSPKYHMKILLGHINAKVGREDILKPATGSENLHEISIINGVRAVHFAISKILIVKSIM
jgi:hypothetical protein